MSELREELADEHIIELALDMGDDRWADPVDAPGFVYHVVAAKLPGHWILRGIRQWTTVNAVAAKIEPYTRLFPADDIEWTFAEYHVPLYLSELTSASPYIGGLYLYRVDESSLQYEERFRRYDQVERLEQW